MLKCAFIVVCLYKRIATCAQARSKINEAKLWHEALFRWLIKNFFFFSEKLTSPGEFLSPPQTAKCETGFIFSGPGPFDLPI